MVLFVLGTGLALRLAGFAVLSWVVPQPGLARHCLAGAGVQGLALGLALRRQPDVGLLISGMDLVWIASLTPRLGLDSMLFLMGLIQPFMVLIMSRWSVHFRLLLAVLPPLGFAVVRFASPTPDSAGALTPEQLRHLGTVTVLVFIALSLTITASTLRNLERALRRSRSLAEARSRLIDDMSHELRTPVSTSLTAAQAALAFERTGESYRESLRVIERQARSMGLIVQRMLELGRAERAEVTVKEADDLGSAVRRTVDSFRDAAAERSIELDLEAEELGKTTDAGVLHVVVGNLLSNAIRYSPEGGRVEIRMASEGGGHCIQVRDHGRGIAAEDLPHIFERYWRADRARTRNGGEEGLGLGLAIARQYAGLLGAEIGAESVLGQGAVFTIRWSRRRPTGRVRVSKKEG